MVDKVKDVTVIREDELKESPNFGSKIDARFIKKMANLKEGVVMILDIEAIFGEGEMSALESVVEEKKQQERVA